MTFQAPLSFFIYSLGQPLRLMGSRHPWDQQLARHPFHILITDRRTSRGFVSMYTHLLESSYGDLPLDRLWRKDVPELRPDFNWDLVWANIRQASRNPDYQQIHLNYAHRTYLTDAWCTLCSTGAPGTFLHMFWECPPVARFWNRVFSKLSDIFSLTVPVSVSVFLLNDLSQLPATGYQKRPLYAGLYGCQEIGCYEMETTRQALSDMLVTNVS